MAATRMRVWRSSNDGSEIRLEDNAWKQLAVDATVKENTLLRFIFSSTWRRDTRDRL